jgi:hypothetical protein
MRVREFLFAERMVFGICHFELIYLLHLLFRKETSIPVLRKPFFPHRRNRDGSYDSICLNCLATVGTGTQEELVKRDEEHVCDPSPPTEPGAVRPPTETPSS